MGISLQTDLTAVSRLSEEQKEENARFRDLMDTLSLPEGELDAIVHRHYETVSGRIDCRDCGNCCRGAPPLLYQADVDRLAGGLEMSTGDLADRFLESCRNGLTYRINAMPCPFQSGNVCSVYASRPEVCRAYPHLHEDGFLSRSRHVVDNCEVCPIVFNVFELLKSELCGRFSREWEEIWGKGVEVLGEA